jgi:hypothetical protein
MEKKHLWLGKSRGKIKEWKKTIITFKNKIVKKLYTLILGGGSAGQLSFSLCLVLLYLCGFNKGTVVTIIRKSIFK